MWDKIIDHIASLFGLANFLWLGVAILLIASWNAIAQGTIYYGIATMDVWYKGSIYSPPQQRTYQQNAAIEVDTPLHGSVNIEENPFYFYTTTEYSTEIGYFAAYSAILHLDSIGQTHVWQYWWYSGENGSYQGSYQPSELNTDNFNKIIAESFLPGTLGRCHTSIAPGSTIIFDFFDNQMTAKIVGTVYDPFITQACTAQIERFEISIEASTSSSCTPDSYEPDDTSATSSVITAGATQAHNICPVGDEDWVTFELSQASGVVIETNGSPGDDTRMWLYDASLTETEHNDDEGTGYFSRIDRVCGDDDLQVGTYYIKIDDYEDNSEIASYDLSLTVTPCAASDHDDDGIPDWADNDDDNDGRPDQEDSNPLVPEVNQCYDDETIIDGQFYINGEAFDCRAQVSITTVNWVTVETGADVNYLAPIIELSPGFTVQTGGKFRATGSTNVAP